MALSETFPNSEDELDADGFPPGTMFGTFRIQRLLGRGGMGAVYEARDTRLDRSVALKVLPAEFLHDPTFGRRFETEARLAARLEHPNIVPIYASGIEQGIPWMSMRLLAGKNLSALLRDRRLSAPETVALLKQVAAALDHAHAFGVVHRDIKPANILLDRGGVASVADFGLAQLMDSGVRLTRTGMLSGTPHYMAPEQALGQRVDQRCDIYALGIVAYEMLVGRTPFGGDSPVAVLLQQVHEPLPAPANQGLPARWMKAIHKATAKNPAERWPSAGVFVDALASSITVAPVAPETPDRHHPQSASLRPPVVAAAAAALAIAALVWVVVRPSPSGLPAGPPAATVGEQRGEQGTAAVPSPAATPADPPASEDRTPPVRIPRSGTEPRRSRATAQDPPSPSSEDPRPDGSSPAPGARTPPPVAVVDGFGGLEFLPQRPGLAPPPPAVDEFTAEELIHEVIPKYPGVASAAKVEGEVVLSGVVGVDGRVTSVTIQRRLHPVLDQAAKKAFEQFQYTPARRNGVAVEVRVTKTFHFTLGKH